MRSVEKAARTVEEATALALQELGVEAAQAEVEVLEEARSGLFGLLGSRNAVVRVTLRETREQRVERFLGAVLDAMGVEATIQTREDAEALFVNVDGTEAGLLIGHHGQTLDALQFLTNLAASRVESGARVVLDVEGYRRRREETLSRLASRLADRVRRSGERVALEPMSAHERRVIHMALAEHPHVATESEGEEPNRRVVIVPKW